MIINLTNEVIELLEKKAELELEANLNGSLTDRQQESLIKINGLIALDLYRKYYNKGSQNSGDVDFPQQMSLATQGKGGDFIAGYTRSLKYCTPQSVQGRLT